MFIEQPPEFVRKLYPSAVWRMDPNERAVYLTFDDGPIPGVTPWVLDLLDKYNIKATFFMVGDNIRKHPDEFQMVVERGHRIGNHTFNHANVMRYARNGSIITFHDSLKSWNNGNLQYALPRAIEFLKEEGYEFKLL